MLPGVITSMPALVARRWFRGIARQPAKDVVMIELLGPQQTGKSLPLHRTLINGELAGVHGIIEFIGLRYARGENGVEIGKRIVARFGSEPHFHHEAATGRNDPIRMAREFA